MKKQYIVPRFKAKTIVMHGIMSTSITDDPADKNKPQLSKYYGTIDLSIDEEE